MVPDGTLMVNLLTFVVPMTLSSSSSMAAHTLYSVASLTRDHSKCTGEARPVARSAGAKRIGRTSSHVVSVTVKNWCFDSTAGHPLKNATTHHSFCPSETAFVTEVRVVVSASGVG